MPGINTPAKPVALVASLLVGILLAAGWLAVAHKKPLWNDELYSQTSNIRGISYAGMMAGRIREGNNTPLFYMTQKVWQDAFAYTTPQPWLDGDWNYDHPFSNVFLRFWPVVCVAAGIAVIFYYFAAGWGWGTAVYSLLISLSTFMAWQYAPEARPYALWFFLTSLQLVLLLRYADEAGKGKAPCLKGLAVVHVLLAFTTIFSVIQNLAAALALWLLGRRTLRPYLTVWVVPTAIALFYYAVVEKSPLGMNDTFMQLLGASLPADRMFIIGAAAVAAVAMTAALRANVPAAYMKRFWAVLLFTGVVLAGCIAVLTLFKLNARPMGNCYVSNRYFMVLAPVGIIMTTLASHLLFNKTSGVLKTCVGAGLAALLLFRFYKTYRLVILGQSMMLFHKG